MDIESFLVARREIQDRLEKSRQQFARDYRPISHSLWDIPMHSLTDILMGQAQKMVTPTITRSLMTAGVGWLFSKMWPGHKASTPKRGLFRRVLELL